MSVVIRRSDLFPAGQSVKAYKALYNRTRSGKPRGPQISGSPQTVATDGSLSFSTVPAGEGIMLYAEVNSEDRTLATAGQEVFVPPPAGLVARIQARKAASGLVF